MLRATWERISALGIHDEPVGERRRIRLTNQSAVIGTVSVGAFAIYYALGGLAFRAALVTNVIAMVLLVVALVLSHRGARTLSRVAVLLPVNVVVLVASMVVGARTVEQLAPVWEALRGARACEIVDRLTSLLGRAGRSGRYRTVGLSLRAGHPANRRCRAQAAHR